MTDAKANFIVGSRGSGKSTLARQMAKTFKCAVAIDPAGDWAKSPGWIKADTLKEVRAMMAGRYKRGFRICYTPPVGRERDALSQISKWAMEFQRPFHEERSTRKFCLVVDEMAEAYSNADQQRSDQSHFRRVILQGRHYGIEVIGITQRPQDVATRYRSQAAVVYAFRVGEVAARKPIAELIGGREAGALVGLARGEYLEIEAGNVTKRRTRKPRSR